MARCQPYCNSRPWRSFPHGCQFAWWFVLISWVAREISRWYSYKYQAVAFQHFWMHLWVELESTWAHDGVRFQGNSLPAGASPLQALNQTLLWLQEWDVPTFHWILFLDSSHCIYPSWITTSRWWFQTFLFSPLCGEDFQFDSYFSDGVGEKPPTRSKTSFFKWAENLQRFGLTVRTLLCQPDTLDMINSSSALSACAKLLGLPLWVKFLLGN